MKNVLKKQFRKLAVLTGCFFLILGMPGESLLPGNTGKVFAAELAMNKTNASIQPGQIIYLKIKGTKSKIKWSVNNKNVVVVDSSGKVTGKARGTAIVKASVKGKTLKCRITVKYGTHKSKDGMNYRDIKGSFGRTGRWFNKSFGSKKYYFTNTGGSAAYFKVAGSKYVDVNFISTAFVDTPNFAYSVDGGVMKRQSVSNRRINVGDYKTHYVRLVIDGMSEQEDRWGSETGVGIKSIKPSAKGGVVTAIEPRNAVIAFYGDSITEGVRTMGMSLSPSGTSAAHSFAWYCADSLNMVPYFAGYAGSGIIERGEFSNCYNAISHFSSFRTAKKFDADMIVVEHGTNDVYTDGGTFADEYRKVIKKLHQQHPKAVIAVMIPLDQTHADDIRRAAGGYSWCTVIETSSWSISYTDGIHPNRTGSKNMGKNLAKKLREIRRK